MKRIQRRLVKERINKVNYIPKKINHDKYLKEELFKDITHNLIYDTMCKKLNIIFLHIICI